MNDIPTFSPEEIDAVDLPDGAVLDGTDMRHQVIIYLQNKRMEYHLVLMKYIKRLGMVKQRNCKT